MKPKLGVTQYRSMTAEVNTDNEVIELSISSDIPYRRSFGYEVLEHTSDAIDMSRLLNGAAVLVDHEGDQVGVVENAWLDGNKLRSTIKFSKSVRGQEVENDIREGIRRNVSIGYAVNKWDNAKTRSDIDGTPVYRAVSWTPFEVSIVAVPADHTVGVGRSYHKGVRFQPDLPVLVFDENEQLVEVILPSGEVITDPAEMEAFQNDLQKEVSETEVEVEEVVESEDTIETVVAILQEQVSELTDIVETISNELIIENESEEVSVDEMTSTENEVEVSSDDEEETKSAETATDDGDMTSSKSQHISIMERNTMKNNLDTVQNTITLTPKEQDAYSLTRALLNAADGKRSGFEFDISQEIARKTGRDTNGFYMPTSIRAYNIGDAASAGAVTFTQAGEFVDFLRNRAVVTQLGASVVSLPYKVAMPRATSDLSAQWITEDGAGASYVSQSFDQVTLSPKKLATYTGATREALTVGSLDIENIIRTNIYNAFVVAFDKAAIQGTGTEQPTGLLNTPGLASGSNSGSALTFAGAVDLWGRVATANADLGSMAYLTSPAVKAKAMTTIKAGSTAEFIVDGNGRVAMFDVAHSNNVPTLAGGGVLIFGDWSSLVMAEFGAIEIVVDPYTSKHKGIVEIGATMLGDVAVKHVGSFAIQKGLLTA